MVAGDNGIAGYRPANAVLDNEVIDAIHVDAAIAVEDVVCFDTVVLSCYENARGAAHEPVFSAGVAQDQTVVFNFDAVSGVNRYRAILDCAAGHGIDPVSHVKSSCAIAYRTVHRVNPNIAAAARRAAGYDRSIGNSDTIGIVGHNRTTRKGTREFQA